MKSLHAHKHTLTHTRTHTYRRVRIHIHIDTRIHSENNQSRAFLDFKSSKSDEISIFENRVENNNFPNFWKIDF